ncbi:hypothetical protein [Caballeronia sp. NK8]|uniref:hypothetical protein n=1 Tax=Caballeronia sp. NK8 TaxID=140098 RepID=UPI001BCEC1AB|nr:hypothetical protein [Caballeronia sp. NK8]
MSKLENINKRLGIVFAVIGVFALLFSFKKNPTDTGKQLQFMGHDMEIVLKNGGRIVDRDQNSKYGSAFIFVTIDAKSWSPSLADSYTITLRSLGWKEKRYENQDLICKDGVVAKIDRNMGFNEGKGAYGVSMSYNALTIQQCKN